MKNIKLYHNSTLMSIFFCIFLIINYFSMYSVLLVECKIRLNMYSSDLQEAIEEDEVDDGIADAQSENEFSIDYDYFDGSEDELNAKHFSEDNNVTKINSYKSTSNFTSHNSLRNFYNNSSNFKFHNVSQPIREKINLSYYNTDKIHPIKLKISQLNNQHVKNYLKFEGRFRNLANDTNHGLLYNSENNNLTTLRINNTITTFSNNTNINSAESLIASIEYQTDFIKKEICIHSNEISEALDVLITEITGIQFSIHELKSNNQKSLDIVLSSINKINIVKADISRLNEIITTIQKVNCPSVTQSQKKIELLLHSINKLIELISETIKNLKMNFNMVILT
jgi:hypothetical protein